MTTVAEDIGNRAHKVVAIPDVSGLVLKDAALAYARAGMHILPTRLGAVKNPGSVVGTQWHHQATCDPAQIESWWSTEPRIGGIAFHPGPSGVVVFDFDLDDCFAKPDDMSAPIWDALHTGAIQRTRATGERAHYIFACDPGEFGCSAGAFMRWGQVRSQGGVVILAPTVHPDTNRGLYQWRQTGKLPALPDVLRAMLSAPGKSVEPKTPDDLKQFLAKFTENSEPRSLQGQLTKFDADTKDGGSRHEAMRDVLPWAFEESTIGRFSAQFAYDSLKMAFFRAKPEATATGEFDRLAQWAAAKAEPVDPDALRAKVDRAQNQPTGVDSDLLRQERIDFMVRSWTERAEAKRIFESGSHVPFSRTPVNLDDFLAQPPNPTPMRIDSVMPDSGRVVFSAPYKAGKTTTVANLIRSLVDGDPFLDTFGVNKRATRLVLIDNEMSQDMVRDYLIKQGIQNTHAVADVICLRGEASSFDILNDQRRSEWAAHLRDVGCDYLIFDCLRPVLDALGLDENHDAGRFLTAFDELLADAGIDGNATIVHHMGHTGERSRGDSRIQDWPDAIWKIVRSDPKDDFSPRLFSATGRDVEVTEGTLEFDAANRHLTYRDVNRAAAKNLQNEITTRIEVWRLLMEDKKNGGMGLSGNQIEIEATKKLGVTKRSVRDVLKSGADNGELAPWDGPRNAKMYTVGVVSGDDE